MKKRTIKISLCDLANDFNGIDNKSIPLGVGFVATYCKKIHGRDVDLKIHRTYKSFIDDIKDRLKESVEWPLTKPELFTHFGIKPPRGIVMFGAPGTIFTFKRDVLVEA